MSEEVARYEGGGMPEPGPAPDKPSAMAVEKLTVQDQIVALIPLAGTIEITEEQNHILYSPVNQEDVEIRPDGLVYLPWMNYVERLRNAFGMSWSLIPYGPPKKLGNFIHWGFWLIIKGKPYAFAVGEQQYFENDRMTYGDALEGAKSNALMRLCKGLGISLELWKPSFVKEWKAKYAESFEDKGKTKWRKKGNGHQEESRPHEEHKETPPQAAEEKPKSPRGTIKEVAEKMSAKTQKPYWTIKTSTGDCWTGTKDLADIASQAIKLEAEMVWTLNDKGMIKTLEVARD